MSFLHFSENRTVDHLLRRQRDLTFNKLGVIIIGKTACSNEAENKNEIKGSEPTADRKNGVCEPALHDWLGSLAHVAR